jgi:hypothetical protein
LRNPVGDPLVEGLRLVEVASVADAAEQLYGQRIYMAHDMRPIFNGQVRRPGCHRGAQEGGAS